MVAAWRACISMPDRFEAKACVSPTPAIVHALFQCTWECSHIFHARRGSAANLDVSTRHCNASDIWQAQARHH